MDSSEILLGAAGAAEASEERPRLFGWPLAFLLGLLTWAAIFSLVF